MAPTAPARTPVCCRGRCASSASNRSGSDAGAWTPHDVYAFLDRVAGDMANVYAALAASRRETAAIKDALRRWQSDQARVGDARGDQR